MQSWKNKMDRLVLQRRALNVRNYFGVDDNSPMDLVALVATNAEITLVFYPFKEEISGVCIKSAKLIAINSHSTLGRQAFSIAHELYHYFYDGEKTSISYFDVSDISKVEKDANMFASYLLMPDTSFTRFCNKLTNNGLKKIELQDILEIEQYFRVSRNAVLVRLISEEYITAEESEQFKKDILKNAKKYGFDIALYLPTAIDKPKTYGAYLKKALELKDSGLISDGKYEEYLLEAFRSDIVFDDNGEEDIYD
jgi:Zn-dependent peptidase ImmA (M78 family)